MLDTKQYLYQIARKGNYIALPIGPLLGNRVESLVDGGNLEQVACSREPRRLLCGQVFALLYGPNQVPSAAGPT